MVFCVICVHCLLLYPVNCGLITFYSLTPHIFTPEPGHIGIQQICAHCLGNAQSQSQIRKYKECSMQYVLKKNTVDIEVDIINCKE